MLLSALVAVGLGGASAHAGQLRVTVVDGVDQLPVPDASVTVDCGGQVLVGVTDGRGEVLLDPEPGVCVVLVVHAGGAAVTIEGVRVDPNRTTNQVVRL